MTTPENNDLIGWMKKNNRAARAARTIAQFFDVVCQMTTWNFQIKELKSSSCRCRCSRSCWGFLLLVPKQPSGNWALTLKHFSLVLTDSVRKKKIQPARATCPFSYAFVARKGRVDNNLNRRGKEGGGSARGKRSHSPRHRADTADQITFSCEKLMNPSLPPKMSGSLISPVSIISWLYLLHSFNLQKWRHGNESLPILPVKACLFNDDSGKKLWVLLSRIWMYDIPMFKCTELKNSRWSY